MAMGFVLLSIFAWWSMLLLGAFAAITGYEQFAISWQATLAITLAIRIALIGNNLDVKGK